MIEKSDIASHVEPAFAPLRCVAKLQNYDHAFGFAVNLPDGSRIVHKEANASILQNEGVLFKLIHALRDKIEQKGIELGPWSPTDSSK